MQLKFATRTKIFFTTLSSFIASKKLFDDDTTRSQGDHLKIDSRESSPIIGTIMIVIALGIIISSISSENQNPQQSTIVLAFIAAFCVIIAALSIMLLDKEIIFDKSKQTIYIDIIIFKKYKIRNREIQLDKISCIRIQENQRDGFSYRAFIKFKTNEICYILGYNRGFMDLDPLVSKLAAEMSLPRMDFKK